jgi:hypothetical protein
MTRRTMSARHRPYPRRLRLRRLRRRGMGGGCRVVRRPVSVTTTVGAAAAAAVTATPWLKRRRRRRRRRREAVVFLSERRISGCAARELRDVQLTARFVRWGPDPVRQEKVRGRRTTTNLSAMKPVCSMLSRLVKWCIGGSPARRQCNIADIESETWKQFIVF